MEELRRDITIYVKNASDTLCHVGTLEDFIQIVADDYTEEDFFSMVGDCYKWELPIIGKVDPEDCLKALVPDRLEAMIEEERTYRVEEVMQALEDVEPWDVYHTYGFDILDKNEVTIGAAHSSDCKIFNNTDASIQSSASLTLVESGDIDFASDRLRPYMTLHTDTGLLTYPLGLFLISSPTRMGLLEHYIW